MSKASIGSVRGRKMDVRQSIAVNFGIDSICEVP